ncbi:AIPR family protein [Rhodococcus fascians]|nr:AIPR family protein [Rhodococcus fascians]MBY3996313.1 AIPR family protein [Rhodococcus fascians]MBY4002972.1 AIPR family protein [Rhodococcus fascians]MBY4007722.1 AIPR family protein [Rhodococcus fascians]MBY4017525.1 AIPR family protein [Rhodococcus fascians]
MATAQTLEEFGQNIIQDVLATAEATGTTTPDAYTQRMIEHLIDAGDISDGTVSYHQVRGVEVSGYGIDRDASRIDVFLSAFNPTSDIASLGKSEIDALARRAVGYIRKCLSGYSHQLNESSQAYGMTTEIELALRDIRAVRIYLLSNSTCKYRTVDSDLLGLESLEIVVWDIERLYRLVMSGTLHEPIVVDFNDWFGAPLACLATPIVDQNYSVFLAIIPGEVLARLYQEYNTRLLELNVRSFLQTKGAVNRGIRDTLLNNPERFLAYNNGISATASSAEIVTDSAGRLSIKRVHDLQIVNGGQTTASIFAAFLKDSANLSDVYVQAKITVVSSDQIGAIVPSISKYSNTQNKVTTADFSSNDPFHVETEKMSRSIWAPSQTGSSQETHWFYERARGQYADELARQRTPAKQSAWKVNNPPKQKFTKTDLAKFENSFAMNPHIVSRGAEKNFREYMIEIGMIDPRPVVDEVYFKRLISKAILFREAERIVTSQKYGGYRANIVTYTIAKIAFECKSRLDLDSIWRSQAISPSLESALIDVSSIVQASITNPPNGANIGEWCKNLRAWQAVQSLAWSIPASLDAELLDRRAQRDIERDDVARQKKAVASPNIDLATRVAGSTWAEVAEWSSSAGRLELFQRGLAATLGKRADLGSPPTARQAEQGLALLREAAAYGFVPSDAWPDGFMSE